MSITATLLPNGKQLFTDSDGNPLSGGKVYFYIPNTTTFKTTWIDPQRAVSNSNPVTLDSAGEAVIYGSGQYRQRVFDSLGNLIWDQLTQDVLGLVAGNIIYWGGTSGGSANAQTVTTTPGVLTYSAPLIISFIAGFSNTGPTTINVNGLGVKNIYKESSNGPVALSGGEIIAGNIYQISYDGTEFQIVSNLTSSQRNALGADTTYYVSTTGNDTNPGTLASPWLTLQHAIDFITNMIDLSGFNVTIQVADGTYNAGLIASAAFTGGGQVFLFGNATTAANCTISTTSSDCMKVSGDAIITIKGFKFVTATDGNHLNISGGGQIFIQSPIEFGAAVNNHILTAGAGYAEFDTIGYLISGGGEAHFRAAHSSFIQADNSGTVTVSGTPAFSVGFAVAETCANIEDINTVYSGPATGKRYSAILNGAINTFMGGPTYYPGDVDGTTNSGGRYNNMGSDFTSSYISPDQTIVSGTVLAPLAHGLGTVPILFQCFLRNTSAELGYSIGDIIPVNLNDNDAVNSRGQSITFDATQIFITFGNGGSGSYEIISKDTGNGAEIDNTKWVFYIRAWA